MAVLDRLTKLDKDNGTTDHVNRWEVLKGTDKLAFALQLKLDRDANFLSIAESHAQMHSKKGTMLQGCWLEACCCTRRT